MILRYSSCLIGTTATHLIFPQVRVESSTLATSLIIYQVSFSSCTGYSYSEAVEVVTTSISLDLIKWFNILLVSSVDS